MHILSANGVAFVFVGKREATCGLSPYFVTPGHGWPRQMMCFMARFSPWATPSKLGTAH